MLGIDPGYATLGWAVVEEDLKAVAFGAVTTPAGSDFDERILAIHQSLNSIIERYAPESAAIEKLYFSKNTKTAMDVARCTGAILLTLKMAGLPCAEYSPTQVKQAMGGGGRATKDQMQRMVARLFGMESAPRPDDAADALAIAACHCMALPGLARS